MLKQQHDRHNYLTYITLYYLTQYVAGFRWWKSGISTQGIRFLSLGAHMTCLPSHAWLLTPVGGGTLHEAACEMFLKIYFSHYFITLQDVYCVCRLITGGRDGCLKIWNFNNGLCLKTLKKGMYCKFSHYSLKILFQIPFYQVIVKNHFQSFL